LIGWGQGLVLNDAFSYFVRDEAHADVPAAVVERPDFFPTEVARLRELRQLYEIRDLAAPPPPTLKVDWTRDASAIRDTVHQGRRDASPVICMVAGENIGLLDAELGTDATLFGRADAPGAVLKATPNAIVVQAGQGTVVLRRLVLREQPLPAADVLRALGASQLQ
jgi:hypothetical protein